MSLERHLVRNRWLSYRFGVSRFSEPRSGIESAPHLRAGYMSIAIPYPPAGSIRAMTPSDSSVSK